MIVTATEFKTNIGKYLSLVGSEEALITKHGRIVAKLINVNEEMLPSHHTLRGTLKDADAALESIRDERLAKYDEVFDLPECGH